MKLETLPKPGAKTRQAAKIRQRWHGALEGTHKGMLYGWAVDSLQPNARVVLEVLLDGETVASLVAEHGRSDLTEQFTEVLGQAPDDPCHGFVADLGVLSDRQSGSLTVRVANTDSFLQGSMALTGTTKPPAPATSKLFGDGALRLYGWAIDTRNDKRAVPVRAYLGSELIAEAIAGSDNPALRSFDVGAHCFTLNLPTALGDGRMYSVRVVDESGVPINGSPINVCCFAEGLQALLPVKDDLLGELIDAYERHLPRSLSMAHYRHWSARFETADAATVGTPAALRVGLIVTGDGDPASVLRTTDSIDAQTGVKVRSFGAAGKGKKQASFASLLQAALEAGCDVIGCVRAGDTLLPHAVACALDGFALPGAELVYTDSERAGVPWFKPAWNPEYALASDYPLELMLARADGVRACFGLPAVAVASAQRKAGASAAQAARHTPDLPSTPAALCWQLLAFLWNTATQAIVHVPRVLYCFNSPFSPQELEARNTAAASALKAQEPAATLTLLPNAPANTPFQPRRIQRSLSKRDKSKKVSLIIPTRDHVALLERCISTIEKHTDWPNLEIIIADNGSTDAKTKAYLRAAAKKGIKVLPLPGPFNFAQLNNDAIAEASGEIIGMINNDIEALHDGWLDEIVGQLLRPGVGAVGAKLLWPNGMVQHGGVLLGVGNVAGHYGNRLADADWGDHGRNQLLQQVSGVTAACLFLRKKDYLAIGGMDEIAFPVAFNDVDLCLKLRSAGKAIIWTPHAKLLHAESASRGHEDTPPKRARAQREMDQLRQRWGHVLPCDPAYHPSLNLDVYSQAFSGLAIPPRARTPRTGTLNKMDE